MRRIVICGGGIAGLECLLALRAMAGDDLQITLVTDRVHTIDRQRAVAEAFGLGRAPRRDVAALATDQHADLHLSRLAIVRDGSVELSNGMVLPYDALVVATGARVLPTMPGFTRFRGLEDVPAIRTIREQLLAGEVQSVAFALPSKTAWALPLYELALAIGAEATVAGLTDAQLTIVTPEDTPLAPFGPAAADALSPLLAARGIELRTAVQPVRLRDERLLLSDGQILPAQRVVALGEARGCPPVGLASNRGGFVAVDAQGGVLGREDVFAAGDVAAHALKQGGLAAQQADAVAEAIAARIGVTIDPQPYRPILRGLLLSGDASLYLRAVPDPSDAANGSLTSSSTASFAEPLCRAHTKVVSKYLGPYWAAKSSATASPEADGPSGTPHARPKEFGAR